MTSPIAGEREAHGQLDPRSALDQARKMLAYAQSFNGQKWSPALDSVDRQNLATALDNLEETAAMLLNMSSRVAALLEPVGEGWVMVPKEPTAAMIDVAKRNLRSYLSKASFASNVDREAALNCVDVLVQATGGEQSAQGER